MATWDIELTRRRRTPAKNQTVRQTPLQSEWPCSSRNIVGTCDCNHGSLTRLPDEHRWSCNRPVCLSAAHTVLKHFRVAFVLLCLGLSVQLFVNSFPSSSFAPPAPSTPMSSTLPVKGLGSQGRAGLVFEIRQVRVCMSKFRFACFENSRLKARLGVRD